VRNRLCSRPKPSLQVRQSNCLPVFRWEYNRSYSKIGIRGENWKRKRCYDSFK
jgi:hypothetical protein